MDHEHSVTSDLISIDGCRELLGDEADGLSDLQVEQIRQHADSLTHVIIDVFLEQREGLE